MKIQGAALVLVLCGCSKTAEPTSSTSATATPVGSPTPTPTPTPSSDLRWDVPPTWQTAPSPSAMRKATYKIPKAAGDAEDAEVSVTQAGGSIDANIDRWVGQFAGSKDTLKRQEKRVGTFKVTIVDLKGKFAGSGMPGAAPAGPKENWALLGAIVEGADPPYFFKLTGPEKTVTSARPDFDRLVGSLRAK